MTTPVTSFLNPVYSTKHEFLSVDWAWNSIRKLLLISITVGPLLNQWGSHAACVLGYERELAVVVVAVVVAVQPLKDWMPTPFCRASLLYKRHFKASQFLNTKTSYRI